MTIFSTDPGDVSAKRMKVSDEDRYYQEREVLGTAFSCECQLGAISFVT